MKKITNKTLLKQGDKIFRPVEFEGIIYWNKQPVISPRVKIDHSDKEIVAQSQLRIEGLPVISLDNFSFLNNLIKEEQDYYYKQTGSLTSIEIVERACSLGYKANPNQYTLKDLEKAFRLGLIQERKPFSKLEDYFKALIEQINTISTIEVDEQFNITSYE